MSNIKKIFIYSILSIISISLLFMIIWSMTSKWVWPNLLPSTLNFRAFSYMFTSPKIIRIIMSSIFLSIVVTIVTLLVSIPAARAMAFYEFPGKKMASLIILLPLIVPMITVVMGIHINFIKWRLANTFIGVVLVHVLPGIPYAVRIMQNTYISTGVDIETQGRVLGASRYQVFRYISFPLILPGVIVSSTIVYIISYSQYFITFLIGGGKVVTFSMFLFPFIESGDRTMASALSLLFVVSIFVVLYVSERVIGKRNTESSNYIL